MRFLNNTDIFNGLLIKRWAKISKIKEGIFQLSGLYRIYGKKLENEIQNGDIPNHVALILDGNRRWAKRHLTMPKKGHWKGADAVENLLDWCEEFDIKIVTLYALSAENLNRKDEELEYLYELICMRLEKLYNDPRIHRCKMRVKGIGRIELLPDSIKEILKKLDDATKNYENHFLNIALAYGGQYELLDAVKKIGEKIKDGTLDVQDINKKEIESNLYTSHLPQSSPDMILRTSGEQRLSGFLMWQSAYSELVFMDIFWPEFRKIDLMRAIRIFQERKRRLGK
ncbi:MAG: polyprenyl diphosphate synthase [Nitrosopumilus sp.]|nr:polyprenyl diphosphate synthase [Nitrosopumilus sp.]